MPPALLGEVLRLLVARGKISGEVVDNLLTWRHSGFSVHAGVRVEERSEAVRLGRYGIRCPLVLERLAWDETSGEVVCRARPGRQDAGGESVARWDVLEFVAQVLDHPQYDWGHSLPDPGQQLLRYCLGLVQQRRAGAPRAPAGRIERHAPREQGSSRIYGARRAG